MNRVITVVAVLPLALLLVVTGAAAAQEPVEISNATELQEVRDDLDGDYVLVDDIDLSEVDNFEPIGNRSDPFTGTSDGDGHNISNLTIDRPDEVYVGLFGSIGSDAVVENVGIENASLTGKSLVGTLAGQNEGNVTASRTEGSVASESGSAGGLLGTNRADGIVVDSHSESDVKGGGGLVGSNTGEIRGSYATGDVTHEGGSGGLVGENGFTDEATGEIHDSYATGDVSGILNVGGLVGRNTAKVIESHAEGEVEGDVGRAGGLIGSNTGEIRGSYATGNVTSRRAVGGLIGRGGNVSGSYATGDVDGEVRVGGLVGDSGGEVTDSHATGDVTGRWMVGGFAGSNSADLTGSRAEGDVEGHAEVGGFVGVNSGEIEGARSGGEVVGDRRVGGIAGELRSGALVDSRWTGEMETVPAVGIRKPGTTFENVTPDTVGKSGENAGRPSPSEPGGVEWTFDAEGGFAFSSPTVVDGTVYIGDGSGDDAGNAYAVSASDGTEEWRFEAEDSMVSSSPTVAGGVVYINDHNRTVYALDASSGAEIWTSEAEDAVRPRVRSPTVANGTVYIRGFDDLLALDASTGEEEWRSDTGPFMTPNVVDGTVYTDHGNAVRAIDGADGTTQWEAEIDGQIRSSTTVADDTVYLGSFENEAEGNFYALNASNGAERWSFDTGPTRFTSPTVADGTVYVGGLNGGVHALDTSTGEEEWRYVARSPIRSSPTVANGTVYVGSNKYLHALDASTGEELWMLETGELLSSPTVVDGTVYVGNRDGTLYSVNAGVSGSSEDSRVLLGTLGHHHTWAEKQAEYIDVDRGLPVPTSALVAGILIIAVLVGGVLLRRLSESE